MFPRQRGVALVITLIMLAVITFMAVTFLAVSRREAGSVTVTRDQTTAKFAADTSLERVKAELVAGILAATNAYNYDLLVSTNFINWDGFDPNPPYDYRTNVNYGWKRNGQKLTPNEALQNLANLFLNPRPPVFITNRLVAVRGGSNEFRFYHDLNRNGRYDTNGVWPEINALGFPATYTGTNGTTVTNYLNFVGDPEWIGVLERPDRPHSATNRFVARYAYIVVPTGKTLDVNYIHNHAKTLGQGQPKEGFLRNQGVGSWEMNLAAFLVDLNTNMWLVPGPLGYGSGQFIYDMNGNNIGSGFDDSFRLLRYRYGGAAVNPPLDSVQNLFGGPGGAGATAFRNDLVDGYSRGPVMTNFLGMAADPDVPQNPWSGADVGSQFLTTQDFYNKSKTLVGNPTGFGFTDRLLIAGTNISSYDRYTFYRLLAQLGTDSAADPPGKININYDNLVQKNSAGVASATNFYPWQPTGFFTNAADKLLRQYSGEWLNANSNLFFATYRTNKAFGVTDIPVLVNSNFVYAPSVHRLLQLAANTYDAATVRTNPANPFPQLPSVFRPVVRRRGSEVYVVGYTEVGGVSGPNDLRFAKPLNLPADLAQVPEDVTPPLPADVNVNVYGVPWVIGAKKGLPNFNEYAMQTVFQVTRKLEVRRTSLSTPQALWTTNMMYVVGVSNYVGAEAWNSYRTNLNHAVRIIVTNEVFMHLTNNFVWPGVRTNMTFGNLLPTVGLGLLQWRSYYPGTTNSFLVPLRTNITLVPNLPYRYSPPGFIPDPNTPWVPLQAQVPQWKLVVNSKLRFIILDVTDTANQRVIDYVQLDGLNSIRDVSEEIRDEDNKIGFEGLWSTNLLSPGNLPQGILNQMTISLGINGANAADWKPYDLGSHATKDFEIDYFRALYGLSPFKYPFLVNTSLVQQVPFTPTKRVQQHLTWQANDPLVHYTPGDLADLKTANSLIKGLSTDPPINNIGRLNIRYEPWGGSIERGPTDPAKDFNTGIKDPGVRQSDDWQFPINKFPNIGWLGRVHRGTPWQTVYMKSPETLTAIGGLDIWTNWTGNRIYFALDPTNYVWDASRTVPESDRPLFDLFTTAFNENASRGRLSVNQSGQAAWSALFSGVVALTNSSTDGELSGVFPVRRFNPWIIDPVGTGGTNSPLFKIVDGINRERDRVIGTDAAGQPIFAHSGRAFRHVGDILAVPALTTNSPFLNQSTPMQVQRGINDAVYEWLPQQVMSLLQVGEPRFVVYSYGQTLRPAPASIVTGGPFQGICTNYQVTAEVATRAVVRIEGAPTGTTSTTTPPARPRVVIEKFNLLPPD